MKKLLIFLAAILLLSSAIQAQDLSAPINNQWYAIVSDTTLRYPQMVALCDSMFTSALSLSALPQRTQRHQGAEAGTI